ncbi:HAD hydrolase family protein [Streptococcus agalactiae]|uniref:HAD hydrolase family protein n=1 Tax=Streptococcus agalactiae TaxID=1311 RepID=UPI001C96B666|nr:HAD hydrolase family protein [Streptococcus agalactiae]MBY4835935.1 HAD hydrolase family protein [Streptococcus agalactiae]MBY5054104.1 HAD hydrolase family protein [Streptococcus agalactiae]
MIKLIATDMDGTFLDENGTYDKKRLANVLKKFKEQGIVFTAASGRSLLSLEQLFADFRDQMAFIAENGSAAVLFDRLAYEQHLSREQYLDIIDHLSKSPYMENNEYVLSGKDGAYILSDANPGYAEEVLSFGDNINDLEMLEWSGKAIATENARPEVKEIADCIIGHHNDQAVMAYLESMVD